MNPTLKSVHALHRWQLHKVTKFIQRMDEPLHDGLVGLATQAITGTGKTFGSISCAKVWFEKHGSDARLIVVVPSSALNTQWYDILTAQTLGNVSRQGAKKKYDGFSPVVITTMNSLRHVSHHRNMRNKQVLYILDEAHKCASEGCMKELKKARRNGVMQGVIAVSGTLHRSDGRCIMDLTGFDGYDYDAYGKQRRKPHIDYGYTQALNDNIIPPFRIHVYQLSWYDMTWLEQTDYNAFTKTMAMYADKAQKEDGVDHSELRLASNQHLDNVRAYNFAARKRKRLVDTIEMRFTLLNEIIEERALLGHKVLFMHTSISAITRIKNSMLAKGLEKPYIYHSGENIDYDDATVEEIAEWKEYNKNRNGILKEWLDPRTPDGIMLSVKALTEGIDVPELRANIVGASPNTTTPILQGIGRSLRGTKNDEGQWVDPNGVPYEHKDIYFFVQGGTTDADKLMYVKQQGQIPDECFITYTRKNDVWTPTTGADIETTDKIDSYAIEYFDDDVIKYDTDEILDFDWGEENNILDFDWEEDDDAESDIFDSPVVFDTTTGEFVPKDKTNTENKNKKERRKLC